MRHLLTAVVATCFCTVGLDAHNVTYSSLTGVFVQLDGVPVVSPAAMTLTPGGGKGKISVAPSKGEHCLVDANVSVSDSSLLRILAGAMQTGLRVVFKLKVLRGPENGISQTVLITGSWMANHHQDDGLPDDPNGCSGSGPISAQVTVNTPFKTFGDTPFGGTVSHPIATSSGELFGHDEQADLSLGGPLPLSFQRYHGSFPGANVTSALGLNWMHNFDVSLSVEGSAATVTLFRAKTVTFTLSGSAWQLSSKELSPYQLGL